MANPKNGKMHIFMCHPLIITYEEASEGIPLNDGRRRSKKEEDMKIGEGHTLRCFYCVAAAAVNEVPPTVITLEIGKKERREGPQHTPCDIMHHDDHQHDSNNQNRYHDLMRENDVWEEGVGPTELGIWELKEDLHCSNETMPILCILLDEQ
ncbi:hypothetical protein VNO80_02011 [Phaseolus coccineus]|uniref:Uncharacterized protein n=1 Tax=Phaseolus coccineus TaxID=3886 RepID=A0AAN9WY43_PHACN